MALPCRMVWSGGLPDGDITGRALPVGIESPQARYVMLVTSHALIHKAFMTSG
jgi:hypothetical protein